MAHPRLTLDDDGTPTGAAALRRCAAGTTANYVPAARRVTRGPRWHIAAAAAGRACRTSRQRIQEHAAIFRQRREWCRHSSRQCGGAAMSQGRISHRGRCHAAAACCTPQRRRRSVPADGPAQAGERGNVPCRKSGLRHQASIRARPHIRGSVRCAPGLRPARCSLPQGLACPPKDGSRHKGHKEGMMAHAACRTAADLHPMLRHRPGTVSPPPPLPPSC